MYIRNNELQDFSVVKNSLNDRSSDRSLSTPRISFPIELQANETKQILIETYGDIPAPRFANLRVWSTQEIVQATNIEHIVFGIVASFILVSTIVSLALFKFLREKFFLWYALFAISSLPVIGLSTGILNLYIANLEFHPVGTIAMVIMMAAGLQFIRVYSNATYHSLVADKVMHVSLSLVLMALPVAIIGFHELAMQIQQIAIITFPIAIIAAIYCSVLGEKRITTMLLAKALLFLILLVTNLQTWGAIKPSYGLVFLPTIGMLAQLTCLIWAMYSKAKTHFAEGSAEDLDTITEAYESAYALQEQVKQQNQMLKAAKEQAEFEARTDMLTQLPNRRAFMNLATMAIAQAKRQKKPLAFIAFDIDNFKLINDQYGHPAGDQTLKEVGDLTRSIIRASDFCGRIGGEEFMIGCHNNSLGDAYNLAERIRKAIEACIIKFEDAIYKTKTDGKNKVTHYAASLLPIKKCFMYTNPIKYLLLSNGYIDKVLSMSLEKISQQLANSESKLPPVELWDPPYCGEMDMVIKADGRWFHEGLEIKRLKLVRLFSTVLKKEGDSYFLVTPVEKIKITVENKPFCITNWHWITDESPTVMQLTTNLGDSILLDEDHPLTLNADGELSVIVRRNLPASIHRNVFYQWAEIAELKTSKDQKSQQLVITSAGLNHVLGTV